MVTRFVIHRHHTGRTHFDLRLLEGEKLRSWSLLREPPLVSGQGRLAIERESQDAEAMDAARITEQAFGSGKIRVWDAGEVDARRETADQLVLEFEGEKVRGRYLLSRTRWYPGNRWILRKEADGRDRGHKDRVRS